MYSTVTDLPSVDTLTTPAENEGPDVVKLNLGGEVGKLKVDVSLPFKKTATYVSPNVGQEDERRSKSELILYPNGDAVNN